ncbi:MAG: trimeric intracellular cation channel family protein, partial [Pontimonas sp.]|nr:trimeric intracellular cation channel family protein [Pontimonas sp.]
LVNEIPWVVSSYQLYAVIAFAGGWLVWGLGALGMAPVFAVALGAIATILLRVLAIVFNWRLPQWRLGSA